MKFVKIGADRYLPTSAIVEVQFEQIAVINGPNDHRMVDGVTVSVAVDGSEVEYPVSNPEVVGRLKAFLESNVLLDLS